MTVYDLQQITLKVSISALIVVLRKQCVIDTNGLSLESDYWKSS